MRKKEQILNNFCSNSHPLCWTRFPLIRNYQLSQVSSNYMLGVGPVRTIVNIGNALIDLVARPIQ